MLRRLADHTDRASLSARFRRARFERFLSLLSGVEGELSLVDVGGTPGFWEMASYPRARFTITIVNNEPIASSDPAIRCVDGDARDLSRFPAGAFDVAFSNSVIEHVGSLQEQRKIADEIRRIGRRYWVQTPNRHFPVEPHFLVPGFQYLPLSVRAAWLSRANLGCYARTGSYDRARDVVSGIRLMSESEIQQLFPDGTLYKEHYFGLTKSFVVYRM